MCWKTCFRTHPDCSLQMEKLKKMLCVSGQAPCPLQCPSLKKAQKILQLGINQLHISIHWSVNRTSRCKCLHWSMICLILRPKVKHIWFYLPVNFSTFFTIAPMPSKMWCNAVSHINAGVVTTLFFVSTWASLKGVKENTALADAACKMNQHWQNLTTPLSYKNYLQICYTIQL